LAATYCCFVSTGNSGIKKLIRENELIEHSRPMLLWTGGGRDFFTPNTKAQRMGCGGVAVACGRSLRKNKDLRRQMRKGLVELDSTNDALFVEREGETMVNGLIPGEQKKRKNRI